jgi:hypothetical protein
LLLPAASAQAQATRTWVSGVGDDANPCSRTAPCKTFPGAISKTAAAGEINCLDPGGFGTVTITKSILIDCAFTEGGLLTAGINGVVVNAAASDVIVLRGIDILGASAATNGINFLAGGALHVEQSRIRNFNAAGATTGYGINFAPSGAAKLFVSDTIITNNGSGATGGGILIRPSGAGTARAELSNVKIQGNTNGIQADGTNTSGSSAVHVRDSVISGSAFTGVFVPTGNSMAVMLDNVVIVNNTTGINSQGPKSAVFMSNTTVFGHSVGLTNSGGGVILSYQNNNINGGNSPTDGAPTSTLTRN